MAAGRYGRLDERFCQYCGRVHPLTEFDEGETSCFRKHSLYPARGLKTESESAAAVSSKSSAVFHDVSHATSVLLLLGSKSEETILSVAAKWSEFLATDSNPTLQISIMEALQCRSPCPREVMIMGKRSGILEALMRLLVSAKDYKVRVCGGKTISWFCSWRVTALRVGVIPGAQKMLFNLFLSKGTPQEIRSIAGDILGGLASVLEDRTEIETILVQLEGVGDIRARGSRTILLNEENHVDITHGCVKKELSDIVEKFIVGVNDGGEDGYFVSRAWLLGLEKHEKEAVTSVLRRAGYLEIDQTSTTILYERLENNGKAPTMCHDPSCTPENDDACGGDTKQVAASNDVSATRKIEHKRDNTENNESYEFHLASQIETSFMDCEVSTPSFGSNKIQSAQVLTNEDKGKTPVTSSNETLESFKTTVKATSPDSYSVSNQWLSIQSAQVLTNEDKGNTRVTSSNETLESFKETVKVTSPDSYSVSNQWLSTLSGPESRDLNVALSKARYSQTYQTNTATYFERLKERAHNNPSYNSENSNTSEKRYAVGNTETSRELEGRRNSLKDNLQAVNIDDKGSYGMKLSTIQPSPKKHVNCDCPPQLLTVSCTSPSRSQIGVSTQPREYFSKRSTREPYGDSYVTMPKKREAHEVPTGVHKDISMRSINYTDTGGYNEVLVTLNVNAESRLSCCLRSDHNDKKVRVEFLTLGGEVKMEEHVHPKTNALVLRSLRTNVDVGMEDDSESIYLEVFSHLPWHNRVPHILESLEDNGQPSRPDDVVWMELSRNHPKNSELGSRTLELQRDVKNRLYSDSRGCCHDALVLHFVDPYPVMFEGTVHADRDLNSFLELDVRYQLVISYVEPPAPLPPADQPFVSGTRVDKVVDFDCILEFRTRKLLSLC